MFTNVFLETFDTWCEDETIYTKEEVEKNLEQVEEEIRNETAGIQGLQDKSDS